MTHDFAKKPRSSAATKKPRNSKTAPPPAKSRVPGWVWLLTGVAVGLFISFLVYLADIKPQADKPKAANTKAISSEKAESKTSNTRFEFYTLLPEREVIVPAEEESASDKPQQTLIYILQAGSFKNPADADRLRAKLLLLGLEAKVEEVSGAGNGTWHRVQVGPFTSRSKLSKARNMLINNNIETLLLKRKVANH